MRKGKKIVAMLLAAAMVVSCMAGCSKGTADDDTVKQQASSAQENEGETKESEAAAEETLDEVTLKVWLVGTGKQKDADDVWAKFNEILPNYLPNTKVEFEAFTFDEYATKWSNAMAAGETVDLAWFGWKQNLDDEIAMGSLTPLSDLVDKYCAEAVEMYGGEEALYLAASPDGELYVFPCWQGIVTGERYLSLQADTVELMEDGWIENLEALMLETSATNNLETRKEVYEELTRYLEACKQAGMLRGGAPIMATMNNIAKNCYSLDVINNDHYEDLDANILVGDESFTVVPSYATEANIMNWEYLAKWYEAGYIRSDIASAEIQTSYIANDPEASMLGYDCANWTPDRDAFMESNFGIRTKSAKINNNIWLYASVATCWCIPSTTVDADRSAMLMNLLNSEGGKELYQLLTYGLEGVHYEKTSDTTCTLLDVSGNPSADWPYGQYKWVIGNIQNSMTTQMDSEGVIEYTKSLESGALNNPLIGFTFDASEMEAQYANLTAIYEEYSTMFHRGYAGKDFQAKYEEMLTRLDEAGVDEFYAEMQRQVDEFIAANNRTW